MNLIELISRLQSKGVELRVVDGNLRVQGSKAALADAQLVAQLREHKPALIEWLSRPGTDQSVKLGMGGLTVPANLIPQGCSAITPDMLPLIALDAEGIAAIAAAVPGGMQNIQDIYPLAPLQDGVLFHHRLQAAGDVYLTTTQLSFDDRVRMEAFATALNTVIARHDILRTAFVWEGLPEPVQVVLRDAPLMVVTPTLSGAGSVIDQLRDYCDPRHFRLDVRQPPLWRLFVAPEPDSARWQGVLLVHHLSGDQTTSSVLWQEIGECLAGAAATLPQPVPFRNFIAQARLGISAEEHEAFFREMLADVDEVTAPYGLIDVHGDGSHIIEGHRELDAQFSTRLRAVARQTSVSVASLCHLAWAMVLARVAGRDDVVFGTLMFGRMNGGEGIDRAAGMFINTLPIRIRIGDEPATVALRAAHARLTGLMRHEHASLALAQRCSAVQAPAPLFTAMLNYRYSGVASHQASNSSGQADAARLAQAWQGIAVVGHEERSNYPFGVSINDEGDCFSLDVHVDEAVDPEQVCVLLETALNSLVQALECNSDTALRDLLVLPVAEWQRMKRLGDGGVTGTTSLSAAAVASADNLFALIRAQAQRTPAAVAIVTPTSSLSYAALESQAIAIARRLTALGVGVGDRVGVLADRSIEAVVGVLGALAAGAAYVPVEPGYPEDRLRFLMEDAGLSALLTPSVHAERANLIAQLQHMTPSQVLSVQGELASAAAVAAFQCRAGLDDAAYLIYTSGSTGLPKGVQVAHRSVLNFVAGFIERHAFESQRLLMIPPLIFDASVGDVFPVLAVGASLVLHPAPTELDAAGLQAFCNELNVTAIDAPAALWRRWTEGFVARVEAGFDTAGQVLPTLKMLMFGGEGVALDLVRRFAALTNHRVTLSNHYGPTEATVCATMLNTVAGEGLQGLELPIGRPLPGVKVYVVDGSGRLAPQGAEGELYIGGAAVTCGYWQRPELSAERFIADPFTSIAGDRVYLTGDLVKWNRQGELQFLGRRDHQVKIRGYRIELGEIEARLCGHPRVREAVVLAVDAGGADKRLVAYLTTTALEANDVRLKEALRTHLGAQLPDYMVPQAYVVLDALPLTPTGKLDRKRLPLPTDKDYLLREYEAPVGETEQAVAAIWAELLKHARVGRNDHFFELGGHSLLAVTLVERMRRVGLKVEARMVFAAPTLRELAARCTHISDAIPSGATDLSHAAIGAVADEGQSATIIPVGCARITPDMLPLVTMSQAEIDAVVAAVPGGSANIQDIYPLAPVQSGIFFHHISVTPGDVYLGTTLYAFEQRERLDRYLQAATLLVQRHDILRTAFLYDGLNVPVQVVLRHATPIVVECQLDTDDDAMVQLRGHFNPRVDRLDLSQAPLWRFYVAYDAANKRWLLWELMHHLTSDHVSLAAMLDEIGVLMRAEKIEAAPLPPVVPFRRHIARIAATANIQAQEAYFRSQLADVTEPTTPFDLRDVQSGGDRIAEAYWRLDDELSLRVRTAARAAGVSPASVFHLAWGLLLGKLCQRSDVVFGTTLLGRLQTDAADALGPFINLLPIRLQLDGTDALQAVKLTHQRLGELLQHEYATLSLAQRASGLASGQPLFSSLLNYRYSDAAIDVLPIHAEHEVASSSAPPSVPSPWPGVTVLAEEERTNFPLTVAINDLSGTTGADSVDQTVGRYSLSVQIDERVSAELICKLIEQTVSSVVGALEHSDRRPITELALGSEAEQRQWVSQFNPAPQLVVPAIGLHQLFEAQAKCSPTAIAVDDGQRRLSYAELDAAADRVAQVLRARGVGTECCIGISIERRVDLVVGVLAILKAGGAYVPLDPRYPAARLQAMIEDCPLHAVLVCEGLPNTLAEITAVLPPVIDLAQPASDLEGSVVEALHDVGLQAQHLAYVIYTSGSSGRPNGVMIEHRNAVNFLTWAIAEFPLQTGAESTFSTSLNFDLSVFELFVPLAQGGCVKIVENGLALAGLCGTAVLLNSVPSTITALLDQAALPSSVRAINMAGEVLDRSLVERLFRETQVDRVGNCYGPTETTTYSSAVVMDRRTGFVANIGTPIQNTRIYILDEHQKPVVPGMSGEIYIAGAGVARGYLNRPGLTAQRFLVDPFAAGTERMYRTGDRGRQIASGAIEFLGRLDRQIKHNGYRIEPAEIEAALSACPGVQQAVVVAGNQPSQLHAYLECADEGLAPTQATARQWLLQRLPAWMVPTHWHYLSQLPRLANGKLDLVQLQATARRMTQDPEVPEVPEVADVHTEVELALAQVWAAVLMRELPSRRADFFQLGGHSLQLLQVRTLLGQRGLNIAIADLFRAPVLMDAAILVKKADVLAQFNTSRPDAMPMKKADSDVQATRVIRSVRDAGPAARIPLFMVHDGIGDEVYFSALAAHLPEDVPVFGLPADPAALDSTLEMMAARLVRLIRSVQPQGPYRLLGWSFGGTLAYEVARQLIGSDEGVDLLCLVDSLCPSEQLQWPGVSLPVQGEQRTPLVQAHQRAFNAYRPTSSPLHVHLLLASDIDSRRPRAIGRCLGWDQLLSDTQLQVQQVPGTHYSMMKSPHIEVLGARLRVLLRESERSARSTRRGAELGAESSAESSTESSPTVQLLTSDQSVELEP